MNADLAQLVQALKEMLRLEVLTATAAIVAVTWILLAAVRRLSNLLADRFPRWRVAISGAFPVLRLAAWVAAAAIIVAGVIRPELNTLVAISATVGVAFGLGAQEVVKNVLAGVLILIDRPFQVGDMIRIDGHYGEVIQIGLRTSRIHTFEDSTVTIPNGMFLQKAVVNSNAGALVEQVVVELSLPAACRVGAVKTLIREAAWCSPYVYRKKPLEVLVEDRYDHGFLTVFKIKAYVLDTRYERRMAGDITERVKEALEGFQFMVHTRR